MLDALSFVVSNRPDEVGEKPESLPLVLFLYEAAMPVIQAPLPFASLEQSADEWHAVLPS